jgi:hypothetical protein
MGFLSAFQKQPPLTEHTHSVEKFSDFLMRFLEKTARDGSLGERSITLIARAPSMAAARALMLHAPEIRRQQITVQIVLAKLAPVELLGELASVLQLVDPHHTASGKIRHIKNAALLDAHEQLVLGSSLCWTGDMLRRPEEQRNRLDILEENQPGAIKLAELAFNALWASARPVPARTLTGNIMRQAYASVNPAFAAAGLAAADSMPVSIPGMTAFTRH